MRHEMNRIKSKDNNIESLIKFLCHLTRLKNICLKADIVDYSFSNLLVKNNSVEYKKLILVFLLARTVFLAWTNLPTL